MNTNLPALALACVAGAASLAPVAAAAPAAVFTSQSSGLLVTALEPKESSKESSSADNSPAEGTKDSPKKSHSGELIGLALLGGLALLAGGGGGSHSDSAASATFSPATFSPGASPAITGGTSRAARVPVFTPAPAGASGATGLRVTAPSSAPLPSGSATVGVASLPLSSPVSGGSSRTPFDVGSPPPGGLSPAADTPEPAAWVSLTLGAFGLTLLAVRRRRVRA